MPFQQALNRRSGKRIATNVDAVPKKVVAPREKLLRCMLWQVFKIPGAKKRRDELDCMLYSIKQLLMEICFEPHLWYILIPGSTLKLLCVHFPSVSLVSESSSAGSSSGKVKNGNRQCLENIFLTALASNERPGATGVTCEDIRSPVKIDGFFWKVEDLPDINTLYEPRELAQLFVGDLSPQ